MCTRQLLVIYRIESEVVSKGKEWDEFARGVASWTPRGQRRTPAAGHRRGHSHLVTQITAASCHDVTLYSPFIQADEIQGGSSSAFNVQTQIKLESLDSSQYLSSGNVPTPRALHRKKILYWMQLASSQCGISTKPLSERRPDMHETPVAAVYLPWRTGCTARLAARHLSRPPAFDQFNVILSITWN